MSHQSYLEAPYRAQERAEAAWEQFLEAEGIDEDDYDKRTLERMFEQWVDEMSEPPEPDLDDDDRW